MSVYPFDFTEAIKALGVAEVLVSPPAPSTGGVGGFTAEVDVGVAGAAQGATSVPVTSLTHKLFSGQKLYFGSATKTAVLTADADVAAVSLSTAALPSALVDADKAYPWTRIGASQGDAREESGWTPNDLTADEYTGAVPHQTTLVSAGMRIVIPVIAYGRNFFRLVSPHDSADGAPESAIAPSERAMLLVPRGEIPAGGLSYDGATWTPATPPENMLFFPRCYLTHGNVPRPYGGGGKSVVEVTVQAMFYSQGPANKRVWIRGNPVTQGYTTFRL